MQRERICGYSRENNLSRSSAPYLTMVLVVLFVLRQLGRLSGPILWLSKRTLSTH